MQKGDENTDCDDLSDAELIDVDSMDFSDDQIAICPVAGDGGRLDLLEAQLSYEAPHYSDEKFEKHMRLFSEAINSSYRDEIQILQAERSKFDSRTFVKPKRRPQRPSIQNMVDVVRSNATPSPNKFMTYNKYTSGPINPMLRLKTFNVDTDSENSSQVKEFAIKRRSLLQEEDVNMEECDPSLASNPAASDPAAVLSKPINIDLSQTAHNIHSSFNKIGNKFLEYGSPGMFQSGDSLMRVSPPSLVNSLLDHSGHFCDSPGHDRTSIQREIEIPVTGRESQNHMLSSMTMSLLDEKDLNTSFLSNTTNLNNSFTDPPSLVNSVNTSYVTSMTKSRNDTDQNIFSSTTFTNLEQSNKLLTARPRITYNNKPPVNVKISESYTKSREEGCQIGPTKLDTSLQNDQVSDEPITIHYSNNKYKMESEKENFNSSFEKCDAFYKELGLPEPSETARTNLNVTLDKQELNEIIQARQKLSLARKALPNDVKMNETKTIQLPNAVITVPKQSIENAMELLSRRRGNNGYDKEREAPRMNATFKKVTQRERVPVSDVTTVRDVTTIGDDERLIDIDSATIGLGEQTLKPECESDERAMVGSGESTDTGTFSSSTPPEPLTDHMFLHPERVSSTPLPIARAPLKPDLIDIHQTISPILDHTVNDSSYTVVRTAREPHLQRPTSRTHVATRLGEQMEHTFDVPKPRPNINTATMIKKSGKRDTSSGRSTADKKLSQKPLSPTHAGSCESIVGGVNPFVLRKSNLPTSKLKQFSSHRELSRIPGMPATPQSRTSGVPRGGMSRRPVYSSNPALSPTASLSNNTILVERQSSTRPVAGTRPPALERAPVLERPPALVRQGTETLRRGERPLSQLLQPKDLRAGTAPSARSPLRNHLHSPSPTRPSTIAGTSHLRNQMSRPSTVPLNNKLPVKTPCCTDQRVGGVGGASSEGVKGSALPRPSRLPAPRRTLRPPSVYAAAPTDNEHY